MRPTPVDFFADLNDNDSAAAMDVDVDGFEVFGDGPVVAAENRLADADFFNSFEDDFDDADIN